MKRWSRRQKPSRVQVTIVADVQRYIRNMAAAKMAVDEMRSRCLYRELLERERQYGLAFVRSELDRMCFDLGMPTSVWRESAEREGRL